MPANASGQLDPRLHGGIASVSGEGVVNRPQTMARHRQGDVDVGRHVRGEVVRHARGGAVDQRLRVRKFGQRARIGRDCAQMTYFQRRRDEPCTKARLSRLTHTTSRLSLLTSTGAYEVPSQAP